jgi:outer membrane receptor protein involved in Fe transport
MKLKFYLLILLFPIVVLAQPPENKNVSVSGLVIDASSSAPLEYATIVFLDPTNKIVTGGITDSNGNYDITVPAGVYNVQFEFISYKTQILKGQKLFEDTKIPTITMEIDMASLDEVVVRAETTEVQIRLDKKIYNIGKDLTTSGATVGDALNNVPSVTVDVDGTIALRGNENVRILINGKPSAIAGFGSTESLRQLPAEAIERVEVITSPSARYDAEGTAGILNIILKKDKTLGLHGSVSANYGVPLSSGLTTSFNYRTKSINIFNTTGIRYQNSPGNAIFENRYFSETIENPLIIEKRKYNRLRRGFNTNLGIEFYLTERSSLTASAFMSFDNDKDITTNNTSEFNQSEVLAQTSLRTETETEKDKTTQFSLNYTNKFNDEGHELTAEFQYDKSSEDKKAFIAERDSFPVTNLLPSEDVTTKENQLEYFGQVDYVLPIGENAQFEAGYRGQFEETKTDYTLLEEDGLSGIFVRNDSLSNIFTYNENVNALYSQYGNKFGKFSFLLGLRMENTQLKGKVDAENVVITNTDISLNFDKNYIGLFPTVNLIYELADSENVTLGYNRRINRPRSWYINPFPSRSSEANVFQGNPDLDPAYSSAFDLGYLKRFGKNLTFTTSVYYQYETDAFERIQEDTGELTPNGIPIIRTIPINLSTNQRYGFEAGILYNPTKWLRLNGSFNFFKFVNKGTYNNVDYGATNTSYFSRGSVKVTLPGKIDWQTNAFYRGPSNTAQTETKGIISVDLALSKDIMNDNGTLGFNAQDLLNTRKRSSLTQTESFTSDSKFQWRERQFTLTFTYRFNQKKKQGRGERNGGDDEGGFEG